MANSQNEMGSPKVSKLPLPISDSPLVIDLPDGQKIVVGKMTQGSVIEVATWRGVGRPDSRTSRLMLGVGTGNVNDDAGSGSGSSTSQSAPGKAATKAKQKGFAGFLASTQDFFKNFSRINWSATIKALIAAMASKIKGAKVAEPSQSQNLTVAPAVTVVPVSEDAEIEAWLNQITEKAARETSKSRASSAGKPAAKKSATTKKAAPKSANKRKS